MTWTRWAFRGLLATSLLLGAACVEDTEADCAGEGDNGAEQGCCAGLSQDFTATCQPCVPQGDMVVVDGPGCCEGLDPDDGGVCEPESADTDDSGQDTEDTGDTEDSGDTEDTGDTDDTGDTEGTGSTGGEQSCAAEGEESGEQGCCEGLTADFMNICLPCIGEGEDYSVDGPGCCEGLEPDEDGIICQMA